MHRRGFQLKLAKTINELIMEAIGEQKGKALLSQIYPVVKKEKPESSDQAIRGILYHGVKKGLYVQNPDKTYSLMSYEDETEQIRRRARLSGAILGDKLFLPYKFSGPKGEAKLEGAVLQNYRQA